MSEVNGLAPFCRSVAAVLAEFRRPVRIIVFLDKEKTPQAIKFALERNIGNLRVLNLYQR